MDQMLHNVNILHSSVLFYCSEFHQERGDEPFSGTFDGNRDEPYTSVRRTIDQG